MRRTAALLVCIALAGARMAAAQGTAPVISGRVFDDTTGCPLRGVIVRPTGSQSHATTDVQGRYRLGGLPDGNFILEAVRPGYRIQQSLSMSASDSSARVDFSLIRAPADSAKGVSYPPRRCDLEPKEQR